MLEAKEDRDIATGTTQMDVNVDDRVRFTSSFRQRPERAIGSGPSRPAPAHHFGPGRPTNCEGIFADRLLRSNLGDSTLDIVKYPYNCNHRKDTKQKFYAVAWGRCPSIY